MTKRIFVLRNKDIRRRAQSAIWDADDNSRVTIGPENRTLDQNAKFHALTTDIAKSGHQWLGKPRDAASWKVLLVSGHAVATQEGSEIVPGLEGEFVNLRESTALMSKKRGASLIEYTLAYMAMNGIHISEAA
jgi:hypothetical protein